MFRPLFYQSSFAHGGGVGFEAEVAFFDVDELRVGVDTVFIHAGLGLPLFEGFGNTQAFAVAGGKFAADVLVFVRGPENIAVRVDFSRDTDKKHGGIGFSRDGGAVVDIIGHGIVSLAAPENHAEKGGVDNAVPVEPDIL